MADSNGAENEGEADQLSSKISEQREKNFIPLIEDVAEWLSKIFKKDINVENIMNELDDGVLICELADRIQKTSEGFCAKNEKKQSKQTTKPLPKFKSKLHSSATKESFQARENAANFLKYVLHSFVAVPVKPFTSASFLEKKFS